MWFARFQSTNPFDHVSRTLGQLDRMGFVLESMSIASTTKGHSEIRLIFDPVDSLSADTFVARIAQLRGIRAFEHGQVGKPQHYPHAAHPVDIRRQKGS